MSLVPVDLRTHFQVEQTGQPVVAYPCGSQGCGQFVGGTTHAITEHLKRHGVPVGSDDSNAPCIWEGCTKILRKGTTPRHILAHFGVKVRCSACKLVMCRNDVLHKHIRTSPACHLASVETLDGPHAMLLFPTNQFVINQI